MKPSTVLDRWKFEELPKRARFRPLPPVIKCPNCDENTLKKQVGTQNWKCSECDCSVQS